MVHCNVQIASGTILIHAFYMEMSSKTHKHQALSCLWVNCKWEHEYQRNVIPLKSQKNIYLSVKITQTHFFLGLSLWGMMSQSCQFSSSCMDKWEGVVRFQHWTTPALDSGGPECSIQSTSATIGRDLEGAALMLVPQIYVCRMWMCVCCLETGIFSHLWQHSNRWTESPTYQTFTCYSNEPEANA